MPLSELMAKILIVDDERSIRELFKFIFEDAGHTVLLADTGLGALEVIEGVVPDFIVTDLAMPEMSGQEFILELGRRARRRPELGNIPYVVMTGENFMEAEMNKDFGSTAGFICFFPKMTPPEIVLEKAEAALKAV